MKQSLTDLGLALALLTVGAAVGVTILIYWSHAKHRCERFDKNYVMCEVSK
jgi:hypothetical protein